MADFDDLPQRAFAPRLTRTQGDVEDPYSTADILGQMNKPETFPDWLKRQADKIPESGRHLAPRGPDESLFSYWKRAADALSVHDMAKGGVNTVANWLGATKGTDQTAQPGEGYGFAATGLEPSDTLAPLGLAPMGMALTPRNAVGAMGGKLPQGAPIVRDLEGMKPASSDAARPTYRDHALAEGKEDLWGKSQISNLSEWMASPGARDREFGNRIAAGFDFLADKSPSKYLNAENTTASTPGLLLNSLPMDEASRLNKNSLDQAQASTRPDTGLGHPDSVPGAQGIRAFHGSPHDFDKFDMSKIGTGEGAQAYGHGLYFAEAEDVAKSYRKPGLYADSVNFKVGGEPVESFAPGSPQDQAARAIRHKFFTWPQDARHPDPDFAFLVNSWKDHPDVHAVLKDWHAKGISRDPGHMYEVRINADPESFLDWDKPLSAQPEHIRKVLPKEWTFHVEDAEAIGQLPYSLKHWLKHEPEASSKILRDAGIPGIKYLDQGSRGAGEGSRNYVVFDADKIEILKKYGWVPAGMVGGGMMMVPPDDAQASQLPERAFKD